MFGIEQKVARTAKRAGLLSGGLLLCTVGVGFLTVAGWFALLPVVGAQNTALIFAGIYVGVGLIMIGTGSPNKQPELPEQTHTPQPTAKTPPVLDAFMYGLQAGAHVDRARR